ncbi:IS1096 element passenger TnpR family protein [Marinifilum sp.]|uniref:IS1096 element passenger TnpR family protein n=1 Tax=Marinifilum sp. TaxID=2033137 RepID=UPI003BA8F14C
MIYRFKITSSEVEDFEREIEIGDEQTYLEFHNTLQKSIGYDSSQMASFYQIGAEGERGLEIALFEMNTEEDDDMNVVAMDVAMIREFVSKDHPNLIYVFDFFSDRFFNISLVEKGISKSNAKYPLCIVSKGDAPAQIIMDAENFEGLDFSQLDISPEPPKTNDDYLTDFDDEFKDGPEFENLDDYEDIL